MLGNTFAPVTEMKFNYSTGRIYDGPQQLEITVVRTAEWDEFGTAPCMMYFNDKSRHIAGCLESIAFMGDTDIQSAGVHVLRVYDAGNHLLCDPRGVCN